jgi:hypothetical protein
VAVGLDGTGGDAELVGGLGDREVEPVPQHDHLALHRRERLQRREEPAALRLGVAAREVGEVVGAGLASPRPPRLVDVGADHRRAHVGLGLLHPRPRHVELHEGGLEEVLGAATGGDQPVETVLRVEVGDGVLELVLQRVHDQYDGTDGPDG